MKVLFICGYVEERHEAEAAAGAKGTMEQAANLYQRRLIRGLRSQPCELRVVSAPFIGAWPTRSSQRVFRGFSSFSKEQVIYVPFHNLWGWRSISRAMALTKPVDDFLQETKGERRAIIVYAPHTPFLYAAVRAKRKAPDVHICLIVPDLPQYMNLNADKRWFYDFCKYFDIHLFEKLNRKVDSYLLLTLPMAEALQVGERPFVVFEGLLEGKILCAPAVHSQTFVYAGKLMQRFGVGRLLEAFSRLDEADYQLVICGDGELRPAVEAAAEKDQRIRYLGVVPHDELVVLLRAAGVLVNPRTDEEVYTRYSFPSKVIEYLQTGRPVVGARLSGMESVYERLLYCPADDSANALAAAMEQAMQAQPSSEEARLQEVQAHLSRLEPSCVAERILAMIGEKAVK